MYTRLCTIGITTPVWTPAGRWYSTPGASTKTYIYSSGLVRATVIVNAIHTHILYTILLPHKYRLAYMFVM